MQSATAPTASASAQLHGFDPNNYELTEADRLFLENCRRGRLNPIEKFYNNNPHCLYYRSKVQRETPLMIAVKSGKTSLIKFFIDKGINMELMDKNEYSALSHAIQEKNLIAVKLLVERGAKINHMPDGPVQRTALSYSAKYGTLEMVQFLLPLLPEDKNNALLCGVFCGQASKVEFLVSNGAEVNYRGDDHTPLSMAASLTVGDQVEIIQYLISHGAQVNLTSLNGISPLMRACEGSKVSIMDLLLKQGADPQMENKEGRTAMFFVSSGAEKSCEAAYDLLLQHHADINHKDKELSTPLIEACKKSNTKNIDRIIALISKGANVEFRSKEGRTALQYAKREIRQDVKDYFKSQNFQGQLSSTIETYFDELRTQSYKPRSSLGSTPGTPGGDGIGSSSYNHHRKAEAISNELKNALIVYRINHFDLLIRKAKKARSLALLEQYVSQKKDFMAGNRLPPFQLLPEGFRNLDPVDVDIQLDWLLREINLRAEQLWENEGAEDNDVALIRKVEDLKAELERDRDELLANGGTGVN